MRPPITITITNTGSIWPHYYYYYYYYSGILRSLLLLLLLSRHKHFITITITSNSLTTLICTPFNWKRWMLNMPQIIGKFNI